MRNANKLLAMIKYLPVVVVIMYLSFSWGGEKSVLANEYRGEKIVYGITPMGRAEYNDLGQVDIDGQKMDCVTFRTQAMGLDDTETIYIDKQSHLPIKIKRDVSMWLGKEHLVELYDQKNFGLIINKFKNKKKIKQYVFKKDGPIQNAILLPFYLRTIGNLDVGRSLTISTTTT